MAAATNRFVAWCKQEQASIEQELDLIASGKVRIGEDIGSGWVDKTDEAIERAKKRCQQGWKGEPGGDGDVYEWVALQLPIDN